MNLCIHASKLQIQHGGGFGKTPSSARSCPRLQRLLRNCHVGEGRALAGDFLVILVTLAGDQHHITLMRAADGLEIARARSGSTCTCLSDLAPLTPTRISSMM